MRSLPVGANILRSFAAGATVDAETTIVIAAARRRLTRSSFIIVSTMQGEGNRDHQSMETGSVPDRRHKLGRVAMSELGQSRRLGHRPATSGPPRTTDIVRPTLLVRL